MIRSFSLAVFCLVIASARISSANDFNTPLDMSKPSTWQERQKAFHAVLLEYSSSTAEWRNAIVALFDQETADPQWSENAEDDDFNRYYEEASQLCQRAAQGFHDRDVWRTLTYSVYNPSSKFGSWLAAQPEAVPFFIEMFSSSQIEVWSHLGIQMRGEVLRHCQEMKTQACSRDLRQNAEVLSRIRHDAMGGSDRAGSAIVALGECGDATDIVRLNEQASILAADKLDPSEDREINRRKALIGLIRFSEQQIEARRH